MSVLNWQQELSREGHRVLFSGHSFAMHCHHYNINLQKTLEDALGDEGVQLLFRAAEESHFVNFRYLVDRYSQIKSTKSKLEMAAMLFQNCGLGVIHFKKVASTDSYIVSPSSHHVTGWLAKHGRRQTPGCHFTRGWISGTLSVIFNHPPGYFKVEETSCKMMRDRECVFTVTTRPQNTPAPGN